MLAIISIKCDVAKAKLKKTIILKKPRIQQHIK